MEIIRLSYELNRSSIFFVQQDYNPTQAEAKWQKAWADAAIYKTDLKAAKKPFYSLVMFPYPSGDKLHIGHWYNYAPADTYARFMRMQGYDVFSPMGFDAFGLPAENHAIKKGVHPDGFTDKNVATMIEQLSRIGCMYDWEKMVNTSKPEYYRWTQWLFLQMYKNKLAYKKLGNVNYCPSCQTVLANEQCQDGTCERCGTEVLQKPLNQWYWNIKKYSQKLLDGLSGLDWPEKTKLMQENWIGRKEGVNIISTIKDLGDEFEVFDSVPQTFMAQTFTVIAPEHPLVEKMVKGTKYEKDVLDFVTRMKKLKATEKYNFDEHVEGIFTGRYVKDPFGTGDLPIWVASFVVMDYGTGIVHCSAHDVRDFAFAKKYDIPLRVVMLPEDEVEAEKVKNFEYCYAKEPDAIMQQPSEFKGRRWGEVREDIIDYMTNVKKIAKPTVQYRLRDWLLSRQRYWGAPIPIVYDPEGNPHPVPEEHLPWKLPTDVEFKPTGTSPLAGSKEFFERTEKIFGKGWKPECDTMDTFVCSSFYYLRYLMAGPHPPAPSPEGRRGDDVFVDPDLEKKWMPISMYIGGPEHACMHLIYARFVMMALQDFGFVSHSEPFKKLVHQGLVTNKGAKMSKSKGNVVSPDEFVASFGSDVFRMYLMFLGPFEGGAEWSDSGIMGIVRFVHRLHRAITSKCDAKATDKPELVSLLHKTTKKVTEDIKLLRFNTAISALMQLLNAAEKEDALSLNFCKTFTLLIEPLAPHLAEELWSVLGQKGFAIEQTWPDFDESLTVDDVITIVVQVNGKLRGDLQVSKDISKEEVLKLAKEIPNVKKYLEGSIKKEIYVPGKLVSFVV